MKVVTIILGVLLVIGGFYCMLTPITTYSTIAWLIGLSMIVEGISSIVTWSSRRSAGLANGWTLAGAIVSIVLGVFLLGSYLMQFAVDMFIAYLIAVWLFFAGIARIVVALEMRKSPNQTGTSWIAQLVLGILIVIFGILCIFNPLSVVAGVGMMLGMSIVFVGVDFIYGGILL